MLVQFNRKRSRVPLAFLLAAAFVISGCQVIEDLPGALDNLPQVVADIQGMLAGSTPTPTGPLPESAALPGQGAS